MVDIKICFLDHAKGLPPPAQHSENAAGVDLAAALGSGQEICLAPLQRALIPTGFTMALPTGYEAQIRPRSGLAYEHGITTLNAPGTIDADYRGEIHVLLINLGQENFIISRGMRIAQMVVAPVSLVTFNAVEHLDNTERGTGGFGSTG